MIIDRYNREGVRCDSINVFNPFDNFQPLQKSSFDSGIFINDPYRAIESSIKAFLQNRFLQNRSLSNPNHST